ncbi:MFS transporter [Pseudonocardia acaciae]|uniref:MFS transporter n=1 Tax=Pseudonocardia acaciae TaxID=551276 RepID=UPI00048F9007|nr:MFS transporter [Pseudonocardia acaciae]
MALFALAVCAFAIGTSEFVINGLLSGIAADVGVSIPVAGLLVSGFAAGIIVGAPLLAALGSRVRRKSVLLAAMALFVAGSVLAATAPGYWPLMIGRVLCGLAVGGFYGVGSVVAADLVPEHRQAKAISLMFAGATAGTTLGVPLGTFAGQLLSWRTTFGVITVLGLAGLAAVAVLVPGVAATRRAGLRTELAVLRRPAVLVTLALTACVFGAISATYTFVEPLLREVSGFSPAAVAVLLVVLGAGLFVGNLVGGRAADRALMPALGVLFAIFAVVLLALGLTARNQVAAATLMFLFGAAGYALVPGSQLRAVRTAEGAPTLASATNISAFNIGVALGGWLGGLGIDAGLGYESVTFVSAAVAVLGLAATLLAVAVDRRPVASPRS